MMRIFLMTSKIISFTPVYSEMVGSIVQIRDLTEKNLYELRQMIKEIGKTPLPDIFLEEYEEQLDKLFYFNNLLMNRSSFKTVSIEYPSSDSSINQMNDDNFLMDEDQLNNSNILRRTSTITSTSQCNFSPILNSVTFSLNESYIANSQLSINTYQTKIYIPQKSPIMIKVEKNVSIHQLFKSIDELRTFKPQQYKLLLFPYRKPIKWEEDSEKIIGQELSLEPRLIVGSLFNNYKFENIPVYHNLSKRKFIFSVNCEVCGLKTFSGVKCQNCQVQGHSKCLQISFPILCFGISKIDRDSLSSLEQFPNDYDCDNVNCDNVINGSYYNNHNDKIAYGRLTEPLHNGLSCINESVSHKGCFMVMEDAKSVKTPLFDFHRSMTVSTNQITPISRLENNNEPSSNISSVCSNSSDKLSMEMLNQYSFLHDSDTTYLGSKLKFSDDMPLRRGAAFKIGRRSADFIILSSEISIGIKIGSGTYGTVYKGYWHGPVAIKKFNVINKPTQEQLESFMNEVSVLRKTRHRHILLFMGLIEDPLLIVTQWCEGKSLYNHLYVMDTEIKLRQRLLIACQTAEGMDYLHAKSIIHRDLKSNNILLLEDFTVKIGDFGLSTVKTKWTCKENNSRIQPSGSILWMAPEVIQMKVDDMFTQQSDVYAYGIVIYELMTSSLPYFEYDSLDQIMYMVGKGYLKPKEEYIDDSIPLPMIKLYRKTVDFDPENRPNFSQLLKKMNHINGSIPKLDRTASIPSSLNIIKKSNNSIDYR